MIRHAIHKDIGAIIAMSEKFYATTHYSRWAEFNPETVDSLATSLLENHILLVAELDDEVVGMVGLFVAPFMFNNDRIGAYEVVWWVNPDAQGAGVGMELLAAIEPACRAKGVNAIQMVMMANSPPKAQAIYEKFGYNHSETSFTKEL
jgi:GNAT superfamily N-acetyltransferase